MSQELEINITKENDSLKTFDSWDDIEHMNDDLLRGIFAYGFEKPSAIQSKTILPMYNGNDILAQAQSGTGKTGAFVVGSLQKLDIDLQTTQIMVISPTRELALQNLNVFNGIGNFMKFRSQLLIGGTSTELDKEKLLNDVPQVVVGTPGRIHDMLRRGYLETKNLKTLIVDEADEIFSYGFKDQIYNILQYMNNDIQIALFSATMPTDVIKLTEKFMNEPVNILVKSGMLTLEGLKQYYIQLEDDQQKYETLKDLYSVISLSQCIIYCNSVKRVQDLNDALKQDEFPVSCIHSKMSSDERSKVYEEFKSGKTRILISSDVTARGIDIQQVSLVINFDVCKNIHTYLHRIGRSARWGRKGTAINFVSKRDVQKIKEIQEWYNTIIEEMPSDISKEIRV